MKTVLYARSSIKSQEHSIDMQKSLALELAQAKGILFDDYFFDPSVSARKTEIHERPQLARLFSEIKNGLISTVYVYKRDRLARNVVQYMEIYEILRSHSITVIFTAANEIPIQFSPAGEFFELMIAGFNQREANQIVQRIKETKYTMTKLGKHAQGRVAFGYTLDDKKKYLPEPTQAKVIEKLYNAINDTECHTFADFIREMQLQDWFPANWDYNRVQNMLENTVYKGIRKIEEFGEFVEIENKDMRIIDELTWSRAQERLNSLINTRPRNSNRTPMTLDGMLFCGKCNVQMFGKETSEIASLKYYTCKKHNYIKFAPTTLENIVLEQCVKFVEGQFRTHFLDVYQMTHGNMIKFYEDSLKESYEALHQYKQSLHIETEIWLQDPSDSQQSKLLCLYNGILREELLQKEYPTELQKLQKQFQLMKELHSSIDLKAEVFSYDDFQREQLIRDLVHQVVLDAQLLKIEFKSPFKGKAMICNLNVR